MGYNTEIRGKRRSPGRFWLHFGGQITFGLLAFDLLQLAQAPPFASLSSLSATAPPLVTCDGRRNITLPDGQTLAIQKISQFAGNGRTLTWDTDGHLIQTPTANNDLRENGTDVTPKAQYNVRVLTQGDISALDAMAVPDSPFAVSTQGNNYNSINQTNTISIHLAAPSTAVPLGSRGAFRLGISSRQSYTLAEAPMPGRIGRSRGPSLDLELKDNQGIQDGFSIFFHLPPGLSKVERSRLAFEPVAIDWMGQQHRLQRLSGSGRNYEAFFKDLSPAMVYSIRLIAAPMEWVEFNNLPLNYDRTREPLPRSYPITRAAVDRAWADATAGGKGDLIQTTTPLASAQITDPVPGAISLSLGVPRGSSFAGSSRMQNSNATYITAYVPEFMTDRPFTLTVQNIRGREIPLLPAGEAPAGNGVHGYLLTARDLDAHDIRAIIVRMRKR